MWRILTILLLLIIIFGPGALGLLVLADQSFGPPSAGLTLPQRIQYSAKVVWADGLLTSPLNAAAPDAIFEVLPGEPGASVCERLEVEGIVIDAATLRDYLIYTGQDVAHTRNLQLRIQLGNDVVLGDARPPRTLRFQKYDAFDHADGGGISGGLGLSCVAQNTLDFRNNTDDSVLDLHDPVHFGDRSGREGDGHEEKAIPSSSGGMNSDPMFNAMGTATTRAARFNAMAVFLHSRTHLMMGA